jgi:hypothetical protein
MESAINFGFAEEMPYKRKRSRILEKATKELVIQGENPWRF